MEFYRAHVLICGGTGCTSSGSHELISLFEQKLKEKHLDKEIKVVRTGCFGLCAAGPVVIVYPDGTFYSRVKPENVEEIIEEHLIKGRQVQHLIYVDHTAEEAHHRSLDEIGFYKKQHRVALRNCGVIDPENIDEYIAVDGYKALEKVLTEMSREAVIDEIKRSGLRGRGGGGFPTGTKWQFAYNSPGEKKYVACNADEGDPGAFMDRSVLEGDPHAIIEAMAIAGYAIGADEGYVYVRAEYPIAVQRLQIAIDQAREYGLLGDNILGTGFKFDLHIRLGAGAFVCGEETALMESIEGRRGEPRPRPPFPAVKGLFGKPTVLNNVETYANVCQIILNGADWFASMGTERSKGTKVFALGGKIVNTGLVEIPMGTPLREIIYDIGGGIPNGKAFKAVQTGGPSGGCIPAKYLDIPIEYDSLASSATSRWTSPAASARRAASARGACWRSSSASRAARARTATSKSSRRWPRTSRRPPCAAWARPRPTPCFPPCSTSATSTRRTSTRSAAPPATAPRCSTTSSPTSAVAVRCAPRSARWAPSAAR